MMLDVVWAWAVRETSREMNEKKKKGNCGIVGGQGGGGIVEVVWKEGK